MSPKIYFFIFRFVGIIWPGIWTLDSCLISYYITRVQWLFRHRHLLKDLLLKKRNCIENIISLQAVSSYLRMVSMGNCSQKRKTKYVQIALVQRLVMPLRWHWRNYDLELCNSTLEEWKPLWPIWFINPIIFYKTKLHRTLP